MVPTASSHQLPATARRRAWSSTGLLGLQDAYHLVVAFHVGRLW